MKSAIRFFALFVAIAGLASASFAPANTKAASAPVTVSASGPGPIMLPAPPPCTIDGTCLVSPASVR